MEGLQSGLRGSVVLAVFFELEVFQTGNLLHLMEGAIQ